MFATIIPQTFRLEVPVTEPTTIYIDEGVYSHMHHLGRKVALVIEPFQIQGHRVMRFLRDHHAKFDLILTDYPELLSLPNARLFPFALPWFQNDPIADKDFTVSTVVGRKTQAVGHRLRHVLLERQNEITVPKRFYVSHFGLPPHVTAENPVLYDDKSPVFTSQFHICIENSFDSPDYFTEKILDCFRTKTVPIYWGASDIGRYFDARGIIQVYSMESLIVETNSLRENTYADMLPFVEQNYLLSEPYINVGERIKTVIEINL